MKPIGPLMIEHRLIEKMIGLLKKELSSVESSGKPDQELISDAVDFFRTYADRTHHGKEEDILFRELAGKDLSPQHKKIMSELLAEHVIARKEVKGLSEANRGYLRGGKNARTEIARHLRALTRLYPAHIQKEDKRFFIPVMAYFSAEEQRAMLKAFFDFDRSMIHEKYRKVVGRYG